MLLCATVLGVALYLLPIVAVSIARSSRSTPIWRIALTLPEVVAFDMLGVMTLARFVRLETAVLVSRPAWVIGVIATMWARRGRERPRWPRGLRVGHALAAVGAAVASFELSALLSRPYHMWDRHWHIPLVTLLRAEKIPFDNTFEPGRVLHYHLTGDVLAAMLQTLSLGIANSSLALSVAHDVMFGLIGASAALLLFAFGYKRLWPAPLGAVALLLQGPASMRGKIGSDFYGYSFDNLLLVAFRPHIPLAALLLVGIVGCVLVRLRPGATPRSMHTLPVLLASYALLAITDEASMGLAAAALFLSWCVAPRVVAHTRLRGIVALVAIGLAAVAAQLLFSGSASPGGPVQAVDWVDPRSPGSQAFGPLSLTSEDGRAALLFDLLPLLACATGFTLAALQPPVATGELVFVWAVLVISLVLFTSVEVNHAAPEAQRFMVAPSFVVLLFALVHAARVPAGSFAWAAVVGGLGLAAFSTTSWLRQRASDVDAERADKETPNVHAMDCRESTGARLGESPGLVYAEWAIFYAYAGCHPSYAAGTIEPRWGVRMYPNLAPLPQLTQLDGDMVAVGKDVVAICAARPTEDFVCEEARKGRSCMAEGKDTRRCILTPSDRKAMLQHLIDSGAPR